MGNYFVTLEQNYVLTAEKVSNVFAYSDGAGAATQLAADDLATQFDTVVVAAMTFVQTPAINYLNIRVVDEDNIVETNLQPNLSFGVQGGDIHVPFAALSYVLRVGNKVTRKGHKRIAGYAAGFVDEGGAIINGVYAVQITALADAMAQTLPNGWVPQVYGGPTQADPNRSVFNPVVSCGYQTHTTQRSRGK